MTIIPSWITGCLVAEATAEVNDWIKNNSVMKRLRYGWLPRLLHWGTDHYFQFLLLVLCSIAGLTYCAIGFINYISEHEIGIEYLRDGEKLTSFLSIPWAVQATIVGLIYPIVLSFITLMLQRRASATSALRVYLLDSAVIPAGSSAIGVILVIGIQYFITPTLSSDTLLLVAPWAVVFNSLWFFINIFLTGFFLIRTIRFLQEESQQLAYQRIAVAAILIRELITTVQQHNYVNLPTNKWGYKENQNNAGNAVSVYMHGFGGGSGQVKIHLAKKMNLKDVRANLLRLVTWNWIRRTKNNGAAKISFPPTIGLPADGEVILCSIENGPPLYWFEKWLVKQAYCYQSNRSMTSSLSTKAMIEELGDEVGLLFDQKQFGKATSAFDELLDFHRTLLKATAAEVDGVSQNLALMTVSPYMWGNASFDKECLEPYRDLSSIAVNHIDDDLRLFRKLSSFSTRIATRVPIKPEILTINSMIVARNMAFQLGNWWTKKADSTLLPGSSFSGSLPLPFAKLYEQAIISFIGAWGGLHVYIPAINEHNEEVIWESLKARTSIYSHHIECSAEMLLKAIHRGDETASIWYFEHFIKWWGNHQFELEVGDLDEYQVRNVTLNLLDKSWAEASQLLADGENKPDIDTGKKALNLALYRYWECLRLFLSIFLIHSAGSSAKSDSRQIRFAANLITGAQLKAGGTVSCGQLMDIDIVFKSVIEAEYGEETVIRRIDNFVDRLDWERETPEVSGWIYGWSGSPPNLHTMKNALSVLLVAIVEETRLTQRLRQSQKLINNWWKDFEKLDTVKRYCEDLFQTVTNDIFKESILTISSLKTNLNRKGDTENCSKIVANSVRALCDEIDNDLNNTLRALPINLKAVGNVVVEIFNEAFKDDNFASIPFANTYKVTKVNSEEIVGLILTEKKYFLDGINAQLSNFHIEHWSKFVWQRSLEEALKALTDKHHINAVPIVMSKHFNDFDPVQKNEFLSELKQRLAILKAQNEVPVILAGQNTSTILNAHSWGDFAWQTPIPDWISIRPPSNEGSNLSFIDDVPVYKYPTIDGGCYVIPKRYVEKLELVDMSPNSLKSKIKSIDENRLSIELRWNVQYKS